MSTPQASDLPSFDDECKTLVTPKFAQGFQCIGPECENHCCQLWNISIDAATYENLNAIGDIKVKQVMEHQTRLSAPPGADSQSPHHRIQHRDFVLDEKGVCPMLDEEQLCYLHKNYGEHVLPMTCQIYPRQDKLINGVVYKGLSISCPEAARRILLDPSAMSLKEKPIKKSTNTPKFIVKAMLKDIPLHEQFQQLLYNCVIGSQTDSLEQRLFKMAVVFDVVNMRIKNQGDVQSVLFQLEHSMASGKMDEMYEQTPVTEDIQHHTLKELLFETRFLRTNPMFVEYKKAAAKKLMASPAFNTETEQLDMAGFHHNFCEAGYQNLIDTHGHAFLNMLLHWIYSRLFNLQGERDLYGEFAQLALKFQYIRTLCGILWEQDNSEQDNADLLVGVIHSLSRTSDHDQKLIGDIYQKLCQEDLGQHEHILGLIKV